MKLDAHELVDEGRYLASVTPATPAVANLVMAADPGDEDGRSNFVWLRLASGELALAVFPQGDTYFAVEELENV